MRNGLYEPKDIAKITGVDKQNMRKLLHDFEDTVKPADHKNRYVVEKPYKLYDADAVDKLRQILIYKELGLKPKKIKAIFSSPTYDPNQALSEQLNVLKEKRKRIDRQIEAVEQMQALGVKNGILPLILPSGSVEKFFEMSDNSEISQRVNEMLVPITKDDARFEEFVSRIKPILATYAKLDDSLCEAADGMALVENMVSISKQAFGFWGYALWLIIAWSVQGEGTLWSDFNKDLEKRLTVQKYQAILHWLRNDFEAFDSELRILARQHNCIGLPFRDKRSKDFIADVKVAVKKHFALETDEEYILLFSATNIPPYKRGDGYASYTLNALKHDIEQPI